MQRSLILGRGVSGKGAGELLKRLGFQVEYFEDGEGFPEVSSFDFVVKSPGFPPWHRVVKEVKERKVPIYGEVELAYRFMKGRIVGITGTNGKSTTTALVYHTLKTSGREAFIGGNYGIPASSFALETSKSSISVLELSSFQIEDLTSFRGEVGAILNVTPDHLDRYPSFKDYLRAKLKASKHFDWLVVNRDDPNLSSLKGEGVVEFGRSSGEFRLEGSHLSGNGVKIDVKELPLKGIHNVENYLCALSVLRVLGLSEEEIFKGFKTFKGLPHRTEVVGRIREVLFINDSKSTNVDSMAKALLSFERVVLIAGGKDKGLDFKVLSPIVKERVKGVVSIGEAAPLIEESFSPLVEVKRAESMDEAVRLAFSMASSGDVVLLSPGCASFDMFKNYADRGEAFKRAVRKLEEEVG